jgi:dienelactone hydrolase
MKALRTSVFYYLKFETCRLLLNIFASMNIKTIIYSLSFLFVLSSCSKTESNSDSGLSEELSTEEEAAGSKEVVFSAPDGLSITADYYPNKKAEKVVLLFHQAEFSRGEYKDIAPRLVEKGYACLAVDLRSGNVCNEIINQTAAKAKKQKLNQSFISALPDVKAAVNYAAQNIDKKIVVWGSSYSAGLGMMAAVDDGRITRVVAISPGDWYNRQDVLKNKIRNLKTPVFITGGKAELDNVKKLAAVVPQEFLVFYTPEKNTDHGSKSMWKGKPGGKELFQAVTNFL